jgi:hypothetical protein
VTAPHPGPAELDLSALPPIDLLGVEEVAALQRRFDAKYRVPLEVLPRLVERFHQRMQVLEVEGRRATGYRSVYFDTPSLRCYRDHLQGRRRRFKIRIRRYEGAARTTMLELKLKGARGRTEKLRWCHPSAAPASLDAAALDRVDTALLERYDLPVPAELAPVATTRFVRATLVDPAREERVTIDTGFEVDIAGRRIQLGGRYAIVETKTPSPRGDADEMLRDLGLRPGRLSKYCVAIAASAYEVPRNPWLSTLRSLAPSLDGAGTAAVDGPGWDRGAR